MSQQREDIATIIHFLRKSVNQGGTIFTTGVGKSAFVAKKVAASFRSISIHSEYLDPIAALHGDLGVVDRIDIIMFISNSGGSEELLNLYKHTRTICPSVFIVGKDDIQDESMDGLKAKERFTQATLLFLTGEVKEAGPISSLPTTSTLSQMMICDTFVLLMATCTNFTEQQFLMNHPGGEIGKKEIDED